MLSSVRARQQVVWLTQAASGWWVQPLARPGRMVIAATATEQEENETEFPHALATVMQADPTTIDLNSDGHVSLAELFRATVRETNARFDRDQRLATEHAQLDDNADGKGTEVDRLQDENDAAGKPDNVAQPDNAADGRAAAKLHVLNLPAKSPP